MGARGTHKKRLNRKQKNNKTKPRKVRKTYSLYSNNKEGKSQEKRKYLKEHNLDNEPKKFKLQENDYSIAEKFVSSESEEELDHMTQLRSTLRNVNQIDKAVESSDSDTDEPDAEVSSNHNRITQLKSTFRNVNKVDMTVESTDSDIEESDVEISSNHDNESNEQNLDLNICEAITDEEGKIDNSKNVADTSIIDNNFDLSENIDSRDPFAKHLFYELNESLLNSVQSTPMNVSSFTEEWPHLKTLIIQLPNCTEEKQEKTECSVIEEKIYASAGKVPKRINFNKDSLETLCIKRQINNNLAKSNISLVNKEKLIPLTPLQSEIFSVINNYQDLYCPQRNFDNGEEIRYVYCLHTINHILKTRTKVIHHNARLSKKDDVPEDFRDQGLVRPKILIIVPFRDSAYKVIQLLINILMTEDKGNVINKNRFLEDFTGNELVLPKKNPKPEDYEAIFTGNTGDDFKIGITVTKKSLKLYADFYSSDIIIASPLGLRYTIGAEGEPERDYDFLASIELLIFDQTEIFLMQNWDHVLHIMNHLHLQPKESHGTDFSRVRTWSLNGWAKYYRQTLIFSSILLPETNAIFNKRCFNYAGKVRVCKKIDYGSIRQVYVQLPHVFQKINANSVEHNIDARYNYFINKILPQQRDPLMKQTMIYIPNYFDYVKIRNYFKKEDISFVQICEYSKEGKVARARDIFFHGDAHFLLYTERHYFFNRIRIKGIRHLIFYQPPTFSNFYYEICNFMQEANMNKKVGSMSNMTVTVLYTKYDVQQMAEIVGTERAAKMVQSEKNIHLLVTDGE